MVDTPAFQAGSCGFESRLVFQAVVAQLARASRCQREGRGFESRLPHICTDARAAKGATCKVVYSSVRVRLGALDLSPQWCTLVGGGSEMPGDIGTDTSPPLQQVAPGEPVESRHYRDTTLAGCAEAVNFLCGAVGYPASEPGSLPIERFAAVEATGVGVVNRD
jgi:hypothetical protein